MTHAYHLRVTYAHAEPWDILTIARSEPEARRIWSIAGRVAALSHQPYVIELLRNAEVIDRYEVVVNRTQGTR